MDLLDRLEASFVELRKSRDLCQRENSRLVEERRRVEKVFHELLDTFLHKDEIAYSVWLSKLRG